MGSVTRKRVKHVLLPSGPGGWSFCSCGAKTGPLGIRKAQREWHRQHKAHAGRERAE
jgi:hypothetical protein